MIVLISSVNKMALCLTSQQILDIPEQPIPKLMNWSCKQRWHAVLVLASTFPWLTLWFLPVGYVKDCFCTSITGKSARVTRLHLQRHRSNQYGYTSSCMRRIGLSAWCLQGAIIYAHRVLLVTTTTKVDPGGPVVIIFASGSEVHGFNPSRGRWIFQSIKILSMTSFGREIKPWVPCRTFTARKRTSNQN